MIVDCFRQMESQVFAMVSCGCRFLFGMLEQLLEVLQQKATKFVCVFNIQELK